MITLLVASAFLAAQEPPRPLVAPLGDVVKEVFPDRAYTVEYGKGLEVCPVAYRIENRTTPRADLAGLCKVLFLECTFDEAKRTVTLKRGPRLQDGPRIQRMHDGLTRLANEVRPFLNAEPARIFEASAALRRQAKAESVREDQERLHRRNGNLRQLLESEGGVLLRSLVADPNRTARVFLQPCTVSNQLSLSPDALSLWREYVAGRGFYAADFKDPDDMKDEGWAMQAAMAKERREGAAVIRTQQPIPMIRHHETIAWLQVVTPTQSHLVTAVTFAEWPSNENVPVLPSEVARVPLRKLPPWKDGQMSPNGLSSVAHDLRLNYASWLSIEPLIWREGFTLAEYRGLGFVLEAKRADGWLSIHYPHRPLTQTSPGWALFLRLLPHFEKEAPERFLARLEELKPKDLAALEEMGTIAYHSLPERFRPLTVGVRLYRAALRTRALGQTSVPYEKLPPESREDVREFLRSAYTFEYYPQLLHPANVANFRRTSLSVERTASTVTAAGLEFPADWNPVVRNTPILFSIKPPHEGSADSQSASGSRTLSPLILQ